jgi:hypothetical protein
MTRWVAVQESFLESCVAAHNENLRLWENVVEGSYCEWEPDNE